jgi:CheY-like chemotaxis protein
MAPAFFPAWQILLATILSVAAIALTVYPIRTRRIEKQKVRLATLNEIFDPTDKPMSEKPTTTHTHLPLLAEKYPLRILLVEDNMINQQLALIILSRMGYSPGVAINGKEVLDRLRDEYFDLILMDIQMPEMDGLEATRVIRTTLSVQPLIIAMTANTANNNREDCLAAGMNDYLTKPVNLDELVHILEKWGRHLRQNNASLS